VHVNNDLQNLRMNFLWILDDRLFYFELNRVESKGFQTVKHTPMHVYIMYRRRKQSTILVFSSDTTTNYVIVRFATNQLHCSSTFRHMNIYIYIYIYSI